MKAKTFWDKEAVKYDRERTAEQNRIYHMLIQRAIQLLKPADDVLDFGCGTGISTLSMAKHVYSILGTDISDEMIRIAQRRALKKGLSNIEFKTIALSNCLESESYDAIIAFNVLHLLEDLDGDLQHLRVLLKPGGLLITNTPCFGEKKGLMSVLITLMTRIGLMPYVRKTTGAALKEDFEFNGYSVIESSQHNDMVPNYYIVAKKDMEI